MSSRLNPKAAAGNFRAEGLRFGIVVSRFNSFITDRLLRGALEALEAAGASEEQLQILRVPGSFEIPLVAKKLAVTGSVDAIIAVGCVLRGETSHYDYVCSEVARGVQLAQMDTGVPCIFCVLTCDTLEQAIDRAGSKGGNKGYGAGLAAVEMATLSRKLLKSQGQTPVQTAAVPSKPLLLKPSKPSAAIRARRTRAR
jgi:6,7-dimethyl-8-ribityllumazine synthase